MPPPTTTAARALIMLSVALTACDRGQVVHRDTCVVCHRPLDFAGVATGIEAAHGNAGFELECIQCHGGAARVCDGTESLSSSGEPECDGSWRYDKSSAHVQPGDGPTFLRNLAAATLDGVDRAYLQFINPGDFRVMDATCAACHSEIAERMPSSPMAHTAGEIAVARYRAGAQDSPRALFGARAYEDPNPPVDDACASPRIERFAPEPLTPESTPTVAQAQDLYLVKSCLRCHLDDFGENRFEGDFRSSGCPACHMVYADDGLSRSADPRISKQTVPHPISHTLVRNVPTEQCTHCHYRGGRIGISMQGYRESAGPGLGPDNPEVLGRPLHGHDAAYYLVDEDTTNDFDETPPDIHFEIGMHCIDCHTEEEMHGNGHIYADTQCIVTTECTDCHGSIRQVAQIVPSRPELFAEDGNIFLRGKVSGTVWQVSQLKHSVDPAHPDYSAAAALAMGVNEDGLSHTDDIECYTCHAGWVPTCYGCHIDIDLSRSKRSLSTGELSAGDPGGTRGWVVLNDLVLMRNTDGLIGPSMPAERFFMTVRGPGATPDSPLRTLYQDQPRTFIDPDTGVRRPGFGQRPFNPHTTRKKSAFSACDRCHPVGSRETPSNAVLLDISYGFGSRRFPFDGCDISGAAPDCTPTSTTPKKRYWLDAIQTRDFEPLVVVGHPDPTPARPLNREEVSRMRDIVLSTDQASTPIWDDAVSNPRWPPAQDLE